MLGLQGAASTGKQVERRGRHRPAVDDQLDLMAPRMMAPGAEIADYLADTDRRGRARRPLETFQFEHLGCRLAARAAVMNAVIADQPSITGPIRPLGRPSVRTRGVCYD